MKRGLVKNDRYKEEGYGEESIVKYLASKNIPIDIDNPLITRLVKLIYRSFTVYPRRKRNQKETKMFLELLAPIQSNEIVAWSLNKKYTIPINSIGMTSALTIISRGRAFKFKQDDVILSLFHQKIVEMSEGIEEIKQRLKRRPEDKQHSTYHHSIYRVFSLLSQFLEENKMKRTARQRQIMTYDLFHLYHAEHFPDPRGAPTYNDQFKAARISKQIPRNQKHSK